MLVLLIGNIKLKLKQNLKIQERFFIFKNETFGIAFFFVEVRESEKKNVRVQNMERNNIL